MILGVFTSRYAFAAGLIFSFATAFFFLRRKSTFSVTHKLSLFWTSPALVTLLFLFADKVKASIFEEHNWLRIQRTFLLSRGHSIYPDFETGPIITSLYGPLSALAYWPATWAPSLAKIVPIGVICSILLFFAPVSVLILRGRFAKAKPLSLSFLSVFCFVFLAALLSSTKRSAFTIHADAPALGLSACACAFIYWKKSFRHESLPLFLSAFFAMMAIWSKQTAVPILIALPVFVLWADGVKSFLKYLALLFISVVFFLAFSAMLFDPKDMFDSMIRMPGRHPMKSQGWGVVIKAVVRLLRENLLVFALSLPAAWPALIRHKKSWRGWANTYRWSLFWITALFMAPLALLSSLKVGGSNNTLSFVSYFSLTGALLAFTELFRPLRKNFLHHFAAKALLSYTVILTLITAPLVFYRMAENDKKRFSAKDAYDYALAHPGTAYFPRLTLVHLLAEGKIYHETEGLLDRKSAGIPFSEKLFKAYLPENLELIGFNGENHRKSLPLAGFKKRTRNYPGLPGFTVYTDGIKSPEAGEI